MLHGYNDPRLETLALNSWQPLKQQRAPLARHDAWVRRCVFNQNNICFLRSFPAAINRWLSLGFDKSLEARGRRRKDSLRNRARANVEPNGVLHIFWEITSTTHAYIKPLKFAGGDVYQPQRESVLLQRLLAGFGGRWKKNSKAEFDQSPSNTECLIFYFFFLIFNNLPCYRHLKINK